MDDRFVSAVEPPDEGEEPAEPAPAWWFAFRGADLLVMGGPETRVAVPQTTDIGDVGLVALRRQYLGAHAMLGGGVCRLLGATLVAVVVDDDIGTLTGEGGRDRPPDAAVGARHERRLSLELHAPSPRVLRRRPLRPRWSAVARRLPGRSSHASRLPVHSAPSARRKQDPCLTGRGPVWDDASAS